MAKKILTDLDFNKNELQNGVIQNLASDPSNPVAGQMYFNTTSHKMRLYNGTSWENAGAGDGSVTSISAGAGLNTTGDDASVDGGTITTTGTLNLTKSGVTAGTYQGLTVDKYGRVTSASSLTILAKYTGTITGDGTTASFTITHNLGSRDVTVNVYDGSTFEDVIVDIERTSTSALTIKFGSAPAVSQTYVVVVIG